MTREEKVFPVGGKPQHVLRVKFGSALNLVDLAVNGTDGGEMRFPEMVQ